MAYESAYVIPPHKGTMTTAEDMQRHFVWVIKGFSPPVGEAYMAVEHPKGENGYYSCPTARRCRIDSGSALQISSILRCCRTWRRARCWRTSWR